MEGGGLRLHEELVGFDQKVFPDDVAGLSLSAICEAGLNLEAGDLLLPAMVIRDEELDHNIELMAGWCEERGVSLAPHGKTTMAPQIFDRQLAAGAWGITAATVAQAKVMKRHGVPRVLIANEIVDAAGLRWVAQIASEPAEGFELLCLVDSLKGVGLLDEALRAAGAGASLPILLELGAAKQRTGARTEEEVRELSEAVEDAQGLRLAGLECFEGVIGPGIGPEATGEVDGLLAWVAGFAAELDSAGKFQDCEEVLLSAGGSVFFDRVAEVLGSVELSVPVRALLRSGCYVTHDSEAYDELSPLGSIRGPSEPGRLRPALELWSSVLSRPEPDLAILGFGKRDAPFDAGLPRPLRVIPRENGAVIELDGGGLEVFQLSDQHAFARVPDSLQLEVGDRVVSGISHPCTAFDKWSLLPIVNRDGEVVEAVRTFF